MTQGIKRLFLGSAIAFSVGLLAWGVRWHVRGCWEAWRDQKAGRHVYWGQGLYIASPENVATDRLLESRYGVRYRWSCMVPAGFVKSYNWFAIPRIKAAFGDGVFERAKSEARTLVVREVIAVCGVYSVYPEVFQPCRGEANSRFDRSASDLLSRHADRLWPQCGLDPRCKPVLFISAEVEKVTIANWPESAPKLKILDLREVKVAQGGDCS